VFVVGLGINPLIATIGTGFVFRGVEEAWTNGASVGVENSTLLNLGSASWLGIPEATYLMLAVFFAVWFVFRYTRFGSNLYAIGSDPRASRRSGLAVARMQASAYILSGIAASVAGMVLIGFQGASIPVAAIGIELTVLAAVILGGTGLAGGTGSVVGTLLGVILLAMLASGLLALSAPSYWQLITTGAVLAISMAIDDIRRRRSALR
jgi:ribose transport system permease protein